MKLKYYLRGIGVGVVITTIIFMISISIHKNDIEQQNTEETVTKSETVAEANNANDASNMSTETPGTEQKQPIQPETEKKDISEEVKKEEPKKEEPKKEKVRFEIGGGENSDAICRRLVEAGLIDDAEKFNEFLIKKNCDDLILPGVYDIPADATYDEIAALLTTEVEKK